MSGQPPAAAAQQKPMLTTVEIQQMLEENAKLIAAIVENQNQNKLDQCMEYQKKLQHNLMTLASLADTQATPQPAAPLPPPQQQPQ